MGIITYDILADALFDLLKQDSSTVSDRSMYDVSSLYENHRTNNKHVPTSRYWGRRNNVDDVIPQHTNIGDDIERVRLIRNEIQHAKLYALETNRSNLLFNIVTDMLKRFDKRLKPAGKSYFSRAEEAYVMTVTSSEMKQIQRTVLDDANDNTEEMGTDESDKDKTQTPLISTSPIPEVLPPSPQVISAAPTSDFARHRSCSCS